MDDDALINCARQLYVDGTKLTKIAKSAKTNARYLHARIRRFIPRLIHEQKWTIKQAYAHIGGTNLPNEMRREVVRMDKELGATAVVDSTGIPQSTLFSWRKPPSKLRPGISMGKWTWQGQPGKVEPAKTSEEPADDGGAGATGKKRSAAILVRQRKAVYDLLTGGVGGEIAERHRVSKAALYQWRKEQIGLTTHGQYESRACAFIRKVETELQITKPKKLVLKTTDPRRSPPAEKAKKDKTHKSVGKRVARGPNDSMEVRRLMVHRWVNLGERVADLAEETGRHENVIYKWRREMLGKKSGEDGGADFRREARKLAKSFVDDARVGDQIAAHSNGRESAQEEPEKRSPMESAVDMYYDPGPSTVMAETTEDLSSALADLDLQAVALNKDRRILAQQLEIHQLRRELASR